MLKKALKHFSQNKSLVTLLILGTLSWSLTMVKSGWIYGYGMGFWGPNGHDGIWHISLAQSFNKLSLEVPVFAGETLKNYHFGFDILLAIFHKFTGIPIINIYFQILPPIFSVLIGVLVYKFVFEWKHSKISGLWSVFFTYFGGSLGWLLGKGESAFWSQQQVSTLINPPFAMSLIILLLGLIYLLKFTKNPDIKNLITVSLFFGILFQIKIYAGLLIIFGLFVVAIKGFLVKNDGKFFKIFVGTFLVSLALYLPFNKFSSSLIVWQPLWFLETMMGLSDRIGWEKFHSAMTTYRAGGIWHKAILAYGAAFLIFFIGNMGTRLILIIGLLKVMLDQIRILLYSIIIAGVLIPLFFLQKGTPWNTIQFFYYSLFFSGILAGVALSEHFNKANLNPLIINHPLRRRIISLVVILLTVFTSILTLKDVYIPSRPPSMIANEELEALNFLSRQPSGVVLTYPFDYEAAKREVLNPPRPLFLYVSTAYVSALSGQKVYLEDEVNLDITGYDWKSRRAEIETWYLEKDEHFATKFLEEKNIRYVYWIKGQRALLGESQLGLKRIFENNKVDIYMVDP